MMCGRKRYSSTEVLLTVLCSALLLACLGLITVTWLALEPNKVSETVFTGQMVITEGAVFTEELFNSSSQQFKSLAFDVEHLVSEAYRRSLLNDDFKACHVLEFNRGSVVVSFDLWFSKTVDVKEAEQELWAGLHNTGGGTLVIDSDSIQITVREDETTVQPTIPTQTSTIPSTIPTQTSTIPSTIPTQTSTIPSTIPTQTSTIPSTIPTQTSTIPSTIPTQTSTIPSTIPTQTSTTPSGTCPPYQRVCGDGSTCIPTVHFCDGVKNCPDGSDEDDSLCATTCDGQFLLLGPTGSFHSTNFPLPYNSITVCRWVIRVQRGLSIKITFQAFETEEEIDRLKLYEGVGEIKHLAYMVSGSSPGTLWLMSDHSTVEFTSDDYNNLLGFNATYTAANTSNLSDEEKVDCSFEQGMCFWRQEPDDDGDWIRSSGPTFPPFTGPNFDHTTGNLSGFYIVTPPSPGQWERSFQIHSLPLTQSNQLMCLKFWYHMFGEAVHRLRVLLVGRSAEVQIVVFQREGNYGDNWNYGQVTLNQTADTVVVFQAQKRGGLRNDIALDDITLTRGPCSNGPPEPTTVPTPTTPPPIPPDCGGPFDLWEPNSTFSSPNYPHSYGNKANCLWTLHAEEGRNIQLHFLDFDVEATYDVVEVRDGTGPRSELLGVFTGSDVPAPDLTSTSSHMTVIFYTDSSGTGRGFKANFTSGFNMGLPQPCPVGQYQCQSGDCIHGNGRCNGLVDCPDTSDEANCVHVVSVNGTERLKVQVQTSLYTACAHLWSPQTSHFICRYLGYRAGEALQVPVTAGDSPFLTLNLNSNGSLQLNVSEICVGDQVISLDCDNQPCGVPQVGVKMGDRKPSGGRKTEIDWSDSKSQESSRVVGGMDAQQGVWPWMVSLYWKGRHVCGASLIDNRWLVTAAHCVYGKNIHLSFWKAALGLHSHSDISSSEVQIGHIDQIIFNQHYNRRTKEADIAIMHLHTPVNFTDYVQPICLPTRDQVFGAGRMCVIAGWGRDAEQGTPVNVLQQAWVPLVGKSECQKQLPEYNITDRMLCAGVPEGGVDSCQGDSGGPLMCEEDGHWVLTGVTSFGIGCGRPQRPGVYAFVPKFTDWVAHVRRSTTERDSSFI